MSSSASSIVNRKRLNLSAGFRPEIAQQLEELPCFKDVATEKLIGIAQGILWNRRIIECRLTAMIVIVGNRSLDHEVFQIPSEPSLRQTRDF